jgi:hypothetical protein
VPNTPLIGRCPEPEATIDFPNMISVTGISDHIGWAECVTLTAQKGVPTILDRRRVKLVDPAIPSAPYHHEGLVLPLEKVEPIILRTTTSVIEHCRQLLQTLVSAFNVSSVVIQESPYKKLPDSISEVLESYQLTCAADGMLYRETLASQALGTGIAVHRYPRKSDRLAIAAKILRATPAEVSTIVSGFGESVGRPWRKEHKEAAAAALTILASEIELKI